MKKEIIILIVLLVVGLASYYVISFYFLGEKLLHVDKTISEECAKIIEKGEDSPQKNFCFGQMAVSSKDESWCLKIDSQYLKDNCYVDISRQYKNTNLCLNINEQREKNQCYFWISIRNKDSSFCANIIDYIDELGKMTTTKDLCYNRTAEVVASEEVYLQTAKTWGWDTP